MKKILTIVLLLNTLSLLNASENAKELTEKKCSQCHMIDSMTDTKKADGKIAAPPMWGVMRKLRENFKTREEALAFLIEYTINPDEKKMLFPKATKEYFGLMPSQKGKLTNKELEIIANYLYK